MSKQGKEWAVGLLKYGVGFGLLAWVVSKYWGRGANGEPGLAQLLDGPVAGEWFVAAAVLMTSALGFQIVRWYILVRGLDLPFTPRNAARLGMVGIFYNTFLPGSIGGDFLKAYFIARDSPGRRTTAVATVVADRALGLFGLILFVAVVGSAAWAAGNPQIEANADLQRIVQIMAAIAVSSVAAFLLLGLLPQRRADRFAGRLAAVPKVGKSLSELWGVVWLYRQRPKTVALCVGLSALSHVALVFAFHAASRVFPPTGLGDEPASFAEHAVLAPVGFIAQALPVAPGGVGVGEAVFAWLYKLSDRSPTRGVVARLSLRLVEWLIGLVGYVVYLRMKAELPKGVDAEQGASAP